MTTFRLSLLIFCFFSGHYKGLSPKLWSNGEAPVPQKMYEIAHKRANCDRGTGSREGGEGALVGDMGSEPGAASFDSKIAGRCLAFPVSVPTVGLSELKGADRHHACAAHGALPTRRDTASLSQQASVARKPLSPPLRTPATKRRLPGHITSASRGVGPAPEAGVTARVTGECSL